MKTPTVPLKLTALILSGILALSTPSALAHPYPAESFRAISGLESAQTEAELTQSLNSGLEQRTLSWWLKVGLGVLVVAGIGTLAVDYFLGDSQKTSPSHAEVSEETPPHLAETSPTTFNQPLAVATPLIDEIEITADEIIIPFEILNDGSGPVTAEAVFEFEGSERFKDPERFGDSVRKEASFQRTARVLIGRGRHEFKIPLRKPEDPPEKPKNQGVNLEGLKSGEYGLTFFLTNPVTGSRNASPDEPKPRTGPYSVTPARLAALASLVEIPDQGGLETETQDFGEGGSAWLWSVVAVPWSTLFLGVANEYVQLAQTGQPPIGAPMPDLNSTGLSGERGLPYWDLLSTIQRAEVEEFANGRVLDVTAVDAETTFRIVTDPNLAPAVQAAADAEPLFGVRMKVVGDLRDRAQTAEAFAGVDLVFYDAMEVPYVWDADSASPVRIEPIYLSSLQDFPAAGLMALKHNPRLTVHHILSQGVLTMMVETPRGSAVLIYT